MLSISLKNIISKNVVFIKYVYKDLHNMTTLNSSMGTEIKVEFGSTFFPQVLTIADKVKVLITPQSINLNTNKIDISDDDGITKNNVNPHSIFSKLSDYQFVRDKPRRNISLPKTYLESLPFSSSFD